MSVLEMREETHLAPGDLLRVEEAAHLATVKASTIRSWLSKGRLPRMKVGRCTRVLRRDLETLIANGRVEREVLNASS